MKLALFFLSLLYINIFFCQENENTPLEIEKNAWAIYDTYGCDSVISYLSLFYNTSSIVMYNRAVFKKKCEDYPGALKDINDVLIDDNDRVMKQIALNLRGDIHFELGNYLDAISDFNSIIKINSSDADSWANLSMSKAKLGMIDSALDDIEMAIKLSPQDGYYYYLKGMFLGRIDGSGCESIWEAIKLGYQPAMSVYEENCK
jgi:tetratricopeptide (TPR) repeat protein